MSERLVIKIGGSLLAEPGVMAKVADWLQRTKRTDQTRVLIAGGGRAVDALREIDAANPLPADASHGAAIRMMDASTRLLTEWIPGSSVAESLEKIEQGGPGDWIFPCFRWLEVCEPFLPGEKLSVGWQTTSDSIAARMAAVFESRLVVLKHTIERTYVDIAEAAESGVIDPELPRIASQGVGVELVGFVRPGPSCG